MTIYQAPIDDIMFILNDVLNVQQLSKLPGYEAATPDLFEAIIEEAGKFAVKELLPLNKTGDEQGCDLNAGVVTTPTGFAAAYQAFCAQGFPSMNGDPAYGGQGLPKLLGVILDELVCSTNLSFGLYPGLSHGAVDALMAHGSEAQRQMFLPKLLSGEWTGTMNLTEPQAGTDLGLLKTKAIPNNDGSYAIEGTKIFISCGEHDMSDNIVHLVLARLPDAPAGVKGISLFIVPKYIPNADSSNGARNALHAARLENKMGIKASATCEMQFDGAKGWLIGKPNEGLKYMFTMMNAARLMVGIQGLGVAETAYQNATDYAIQRLQGRALSGAKNPSGVADPLIVHGDVRRMLLTMRAQIEGARAMAYEMAMMLDIAAKHPDAATRAKANDHVALFTPIVKSFLTDLGYEAANTGMQVWGGHGYIKDNGMEQLARDVRITQIYEGTNGVQAMDLVGRKLPLKGGAVMMGWMQELAGDIAAAQSHAALKPLADDLAKAQKHLAKASQHLASKAMSNPEEVGAAAVDYQRLFALTAMGKQWLRMAKAAEAQIAAGKGSPFYADKLQLADFYMKKILPETSGLLAKIEAGATPTMGLAPTRFTRQNEGVGRTPQP